jgi:hypothetical protein
MALRQAIAEERQKLKEKHNKPHQERYRSFLTELANQGDEKALLNYVGSAQVTLPMPYRML